jgi:hypothetical protein
MGDLSRAGYNLAPRPRPDAGVRRAAIAARLVHRRRHDPHARPVYLEVVAMAVAALRVIAQQQVRVLFGQQGGKLSGRFGNVPPHEPGPARRILEQNRFVPAVRVAEVHGLVRAEDRGALSAARPAAGLDPGWPTCHHRRPRR